MGGYAWWGVCAYEVKEGRRACRAGITDRCELPNMALGTECGFSARIIHA